MIASTKTIHPQLNLFNMPIITGEILRDKGIEKAVDHANETHIQWSEQAFDFLMKYIKTSTEFMAEDVRQASIGIVPHPPSLRAWGGIIVRAAKAGLIKKTGFRNVKNIKAHCTPASIWAKI